MFGDMYMLHLKSTDPANEQTEMLVIPVCEDKELNGNPAIKDIVRRIRRLKEFKGASGEEIILYDLPSLKTKRVKVVGLGKSTEVSTENLRSLGGTGGWPGRRQKIIDALDCGPRNFSAYD